MQRQSSITTAASATPGLLQYPVSGTFCPTTLSGVPDTQLSLGDGGALQRFVRIKRQSHSRATRGN